MNGIGDAWSSEKRGEGMAIEYYCEKIELMYYHQGCKCPVCGRIMKLVYYNGEYHDIDKNYEKVDFSHIYPKPRSGKRATLWKKKFRLYGDSAMNGTTAHTTCNQKHASIHESMKAKFKDKATCTDYQAERREAFLRRHPLFADYVNCKIKSIGG